MENTEFVDVETPQEKKRFYSSWLETAILIAILCAALALRTTGLMWGENKYLHPDERFLVWVTADIQPIDSFGQYFDTAKSTLNPVNTGHGFYVYGTWPVLLTHFLANALQPGTGWEDYLAVGRAIATGFDLLAVFLAYLIAERLFNRKVGLLAAAFSAFAVMQIQQSHFYTVDSFATGFVTLAVYFAVRLLTQPRKETASLEKGWWAEKETLFNSVLFGLAVGMAMASKINTAPVALLLPLVVGLRRFTGDSPQNNNRVWLTLRDFVAGGFVAILVFRVAQPYAFSGPGFFNIIPDQTWIENLKSLAAQASGDVDFPPALQWARRSITFAWENLTIWGLGLPLGITAWLGFLWMAWRMLKGEWRRLLPLWAWTAAYFVWLSTSGNPTMRYMLPIYVPLEIMAAWGIFELWGSRKQFTWRWFHLGPRTWKTLGGVLGVSLLVATGMWAYAFTRIYTVPVTRLDASRWIYDNIPSAINLQLDGENGSSQIPLATRQGQSISNNQPLLLAFTLPEDGLLQNISFEHIINPSVDGAQITLLAQITADREGQVVLDEARVVSAYAQTGDDPRGDSVTFNTSFAPLSSGTTYFLRLSNEKPGSAVNVYGIPKLSMVVGNSFKKVILPEPSQLIEPETSFIVTFTPQSSGGKLTSVELPHVVDWLGSSGQKTLRISVFSVADQTTPLTSAEINAEFTASGDLRGGGYTANFNPVIELTQNQTYTLVLEETAGEGALGLSGSRAALESSWDDPLPYSTDGYNPYDYYTGLYRSDLNFEMYWDDNVDKLSRFETILDEADTLFISSNRQWGTTTRVPERYPLTTAYYRALLGCPAEQDLLYCYRTAKPGSYSGTLGYELVATFQSNPNVFGIEINDQFAEEAFTVYDHPKVLIFQKTADYNSEEVHQFLESVDLTNVVHVTPGKAGSTPANILLPGDRLAEQQAGGTWSDLYDVKAFYNANPWLAAVLWYVVVALLGWAVYPFVRLALGGLADKGYPFARLVGLVVVAYFTWLGGSAGIPVTRWMITAVIGGLVLVNAVFVALQRAALKEEWKTRRKYIIVVELVALAFFLIDLFIRLGNPDLWHQYKGGEKPMDFSYFNAVIKSTTFPPYDPWFAGGYINYYYYGFVLIGVLVKWLGIEPTIAYNLILPTLFMMLALGAFSIGWNLLHRWNGTAGEETDGECKNFSKRSFIAGVGSAVGLLILGNWGTVRMIWTGLQRLAAPNGVIDGANFLQQSVWAVQGVGRFFSGTPLPYAQGDWYWIPSRALPGSAITEFPFFTFLYGDPHAHMIALPVTVLSLGWALSILRGGWKWGENGRLGKLSFACSLALGAMAVGALRGTNTWDMPAYLVICALALLYTCWKYGDFHFSILSGLSDEIQRGLVALGTTVLFVILVFAAYAPFAAWYSQGYNSIELWDGERSPFWSYMVHWGVFLFFIVSWMIHETIHWMKETPVSALNKLRPYRGTIILMLVAFAAVIAGLTVMHIEIAWLTLPLMVWTVLLLLRPGQSDAKRFVLFLVGSGLTLTLAVEVVRLVGDIERMNTVFKFYLQAWTMLSLSAAAGLFWMLPEITTGWNSRWSRVWQAAMVVLIFGAALFPVFGGADKIRDRMDVTAPHSLDGMAYMANAVFNDPIGKTVDLSEDFRAIQWMLQNVQGSPVIVEANTPEYRWGSRFTIYSGLPGVVGWNWHQRQQRATTPSEWVTNRVGEIESFYNTLNQSDAESFLRKYNVRYIIVGRLEQAYYSAEGLSKFPAWNGVVWNEVYQDGGTSIYEVID